MPSAPKNPDAIRVHVHYPQTDGRIVLRTDADWDRDLEPTEVDADSGVHTFDIEAKEPFVYYKPLLRQEGEERWSCGPNRLATSGALRDFDVFPFFTPSSARLGTLQTVDSEWGSWSVRTFLPPGYDENTRHRYPVLYMHDGHNLFQAHESATGKDWEVDDTLHQLDQMTSIEQVLVVGVYPNDRMSDYTRSGGDAYRSFLTKALIPRIDADYRTLTGPEHTAVLGSSLGGVAALECAWSHPEHFGMAGCLSASFGYDDDLAARVLAEPAPRIRVYLDSGWPRDNFEVTRDMRARLVRAGLVDGVELRYAAFPGARHSETDWGDRAHLPFQFFFGHGPETRSQAGQEAAAEAAG